MITRTEYRNARRLMRDNGKHALRWFPERIRQVMAALEEQLDDDLAEKAEFYEFGALNGLELTGLPAAWNRHLSKLVSPFTFYSRPVTRQQAILISQSLWSN